MSKETKGVIFDLDGVLVDTAKYHFRSWIRLSRELGFELDHKVEERLKGISRMDSLEIVLAEGGITNFNQEEKERLTAQKNTWYLESLEGLDRDVILDGVITFLEKLKAKKIPIAVGSASRNATTILHKLDMAHYFVSIVDGNHVIHTKPNPEVFINAARDLQLSEKDCTVFEDSQKGIKAAKEGGFRVIGVGDEKNLNEAEFVIKGFEGLEVADIMAF